MIFFRLINYMKFCISANENLNIPWTMGTSLVRFGAQGHGDIGLIKKPLNRYKRVWKLIRTVSGYHLDCSTPGGIKYRKCRTYPGALTLIQAAELSHLSPNYILLRIKKKEIFASLIGTRFVISKKSIIEYISSEKVILSSATLKIMIKEFSASFQLNCNQNN